MLARPIPWSRIPCLSTVVMDFCMERQRVLWVFAVFPSLESYCNIREFCFSSTRYSRRPIVSESVSRFVVFLRVYLRIPCSQRILEALALLHSLYSVRSKNHLPVSSNNPCSASLWGASYSLSVIQLNTPSRVWAARSKHAVNNYHLSDMF